MQFLRLTVDEILGDEFDITDLEQARGQRLSALRLFQGGKGHLAAAGKNLPSGIESKLGGIGERLGLDEHVNHD